MTKDLDQLISDKATPVLVVALIAGSSFLLGNHYQRRSANDTVTASQPPTTEHAPADSAISSIEQSLVAPTATTAPDSATPAPAAPRTTPAPAPTGKINVNTASQAQLETITGIGPTKAKAIIDYRQANGPFLRIEDLDKVKGIGPATIEKIRGEITV